MRNQVPLAQIREAIVEFYGETGRIPRIKVPEKCGGDTITLVLGGQVRTITVEVFPDLRELGVFPGEVLLT